MRTFSSTTTLQSNPGTTDLVFSVSPPVERAPSRFKLFSPKWFGCLILLFTIALASKSFGQVCSAGADITITCVNGITPSTSALLATPIGGTWSNATNNPTVATFTPNAAVTIAGNLEAGVYRFIYTTALPDCSDTVQVTVPDCQSLCLPVEVSDTLVCAGSVLDLTSLVSGFDNLLSSAFTTGGVDGIAIANPTAFVADSATTLTLVASNLLGCSDTTTLTINVSPLLDLASSVSDTLVCAGSVLDLTSLVSGFDTLLNVGFDLGGIAIANPTAFVADSTTVLTFSASNLLGCSDTTALTINVSPLLDLASSVTDTLVCSGSVLDLTSLVSGFDTLLNVGFDLGGIAIANPTAFVADSTTVLTFSASNLLGCTDTTTLTINVSPLLDLASSVTDTLVCSGSVLDLTGLVSGFDTLLNVGFDLGGIAIANPTAFVADSTTVLTFSASNLLGCSDTTTLTINVSPLLDLASSVTDTLVCAGSVLDLTSLVSGFDTLLNAGFDLGGIAIANPTAFVADSATTLTLVASNLLGCTDTTALTINVSPLLDLASSVTDTLVCSGSVLDLTSLVSGFDTLLNAAFRIGGVNGIAVADASAFVTDSTTTLTLVASNLLGCSYTTTLTVNVNPAVALTVSDTSVCAGSVLDLTSLVSGFDNLLSSAFTTGGVGGIAIANPTAFVADSTTTLTLVASNLLGCSDTTTLTINVSPLLDLASSVSDTLVCAGSVLDLTSLVSGFDTLLNVGFDLGGIAIANPTAFVADSATTLTLVASNLLGCSDTTTLTVNVSPLLDLASSVSDTLVCAGSVLDLTGLVSGFDTLLNVGFDLGGIAIANPTAFVADSTTTLTLVASNLLGCSDTTTLTVNVSPLLDLASSVTDTLVCAGSVLDLTGLVSGFDTLLNVGFDLGGIAIANPTAFVADSATTLTLVASNLLGCSDTTTLTVNVSPLLDLASSVSDTLVCAGSVLDLTGLVSGFDTLLNVGFDLGGIAIANPTAFVADSTTVLTLTASNLLGCSDTTTLTINVSPLLDLASSVTDTLVCAGSVLDLTSLVSGFDTLLNVGFDLGGIAIANPTAFVADSTTTLTLVASNLLGCSDTTTLTVNVSPLLDLASSVTDTLVCAGSVLDLTGLVSGFDTLLNVGFDLGGIAIANPTAFVADSTTVLTITASNLLGCSDTTTLTVNVSPLLDLASSVSDTLVCAGSVLDLTSLVSGFDTLLNVGFDLGGIAVANPTAFVADSATTLTLVASNLLGCSDTTTLTINVSPLLDLASSVTDTLVCAGSVLDLTGLVSGFDTLLNAAFRIGGVNGIAVADASAFVTDSTTTLTLVASNLLGCSYTTTLTVNVNPAVALTVSNTSVCAGSVLDLTDLVAGFDTLLNVTFEVDGLPVTNASAFVADSTVTIQVTASTVLGCSDTKPVLISVLDCGQIVDLSLSKSVDRKMAMLGDTVTYTIKVWNEGQGDATGVVVTDSLNMGVQFVSQTTAAGSYNPTTRQWTIGSLAQGDTVRLLIRARVVAQGVWFNTAEITSMTEKDEDSTPGNGVDGEDDIDRECFTVPVLVCRGQGTAVDLMVPAEYTGVVWFRKTQGGEPVQVATGNTFQVVESELGTYEYTFTSNSGTCPAEGCCPTIVVVQDCCSVNVCVPFTITKKLR